MTHSRRSLPILAAALGALLAVSVLVAAAAPALAQTGRGDPDWVNPDVIALRDEVELLRREVERMRAGVAVNGGAAPGVGGAISGDFYVRLEQLETETRRLIGDVERLNFETGRAIAARDAQIAELYARVATLEGVAGVTPPPSSAPAPGEGPSVGASAGGATIAPTPTPGAAAGPGAGASEASAGARPPGTLGELTAGQSGAGVSDAPIFETPGAAAAAAGGATAAAGAGAVAPPPIGADPAAGAAPPPLTAPATYEEALEYLRSRELDRAEVAFESFIANNPQDPRIGEATYWLGETYYVRGQFDKAARAFLSSFREHPTGSKAPDSLLRLGVTLAQLGQKAEACASFEQVGVRYPDAPQTLLRRADVEARRAGCA